MDKAILVIHVVVAVALVVLILIQRSSADGGAAFGGGGSSQSLLGAGGSAPLLTKVTVALVTVFFITSLVLAYLNRYYGDGDKIIIPAAETVKELGQPINNSDIPTVQVNPVEDVPASDIPSGDVPGSVTVNDDLPASK